MRNLLQRALTVLALSTLMMLASCSGNRFFGGVPVPKGAQTDKVSRDLPKKPSYMSPAQLPVPPAGANAKTELKKTREHVTHLNSRLSKSGRWYDGVRKTYRNK